MLELKNITHIINKNKILDDINLTLEEGKFYVITGPNGAGKSFLAKIIMGIQTQTSGKIFFNGKDITNLPINKRADIGIRFAFQTPVKFKGITVFDILKLSSNEDITMNKACEILSSVGLCARDYISRDIDSSLSGGELKRIEIASVLSKNGALTIFDEPEAGIDIWSFNKLIDVFNDLKEKNKKGTILIISHQERILNVADEIILIEGGKLIKKAHKSQMLKELGIMNNTGLCDILKEGSDE